MVVWGVDVVVGVAFPVLCVQNGTWCAVCEVGAADMHRLCFPIAMYSTCMGMGGGAGKPVVAGLEGCGLCACVGCLTQALLGRPQGTQVGVWEAVACACLRSAHGFRYPYVS